MSRLLTLKWARRCYSSWKNGSISIVTPNELEKREFNAEAAVCRNELSGTAIAEAQKVLSATRASSGSSNQKPAASLLPAIFYLLAFERGRKMESAEIAIMKRFLPQLDELCGTLSVTDLAIISAAMHRAQLSVTDRRLLSSLLTALCKCSDSSPALRVLKLLDLSVRRSLPPESLPTDDQLATLASSLSRLLLSSKLSPLYSSRVLRFWQKLRITTPELESATHSFFDEVIKEGGARPLKNWRCKDISQAAFTAGFFSSNWSKFAEFTFKELEHRLASNGDEKYTNEILHFPDSYFQAVFGLLTHTDCPESKIRDLVESNDIFSRPPSSGARSAEAWRAVRVACGLEVDNAPTFHKTSHADDLNSASEWQSQRLTGRQYMALQVADAARAAFPSNKVQVTQMLPTFASDAKLDVVIHDVEHDDSRMTISFLPLPELACFRRLTLVGSAGDPQKKHLMSFYKPQGSESLRLRCIVRAGLVDKALPIIWPTWRTLRENNRHVFIRNLVFKIFAQK